MKRVDLVRKLEQSGCELIRTAGGTIGIAIREPGSLSQCRDTGKLTRISRSIF